MASRGERVEVHLRHGRCRLRTRQGHHHRLARPSLQVPRPEGRPPEARPLRQRRPGHHEPVRARRGVRAGRRRRDRPRPRPLRAVHRREPAPRLQLHHRRRVQRGASRRSAAATTSARPCRSSRTSPTRSRSASARSPRRRTPTSSIVEVGGTVGDIESLPFLEAIRQLRNEVGRDNCAFVHVSLMPFIGPTGELKTKPTQHSVKELRSLGLQPDVIVCRSDRPIGRNLKEKISLLCDVPISGVICAVDADVDLRGAAGAAPRGPRRRARAPPADRRRARPVRVAGARRADRRGRRPGDDRDRRQVREPARRVPLGDGGAEARRVPPRRRRADRVGRLRRPRRVGDRGRARRASTASWSPAGSASAASRARSRRSGTRASTASRSSASASACSAPSSSSPATCAASRARTPASSTRPRRTR